MEGNATIHFNTATTTLPPSTDTTLKTFEPLLTDVDAFYFRAIMISFADFLLSISGSVVNIINIIVFTKLGFKDAINVSLLGLSCSDFGSCFSMIFACIFHTPGFSELKLPFDQSTVHSYSSWAHMTFVYVSCCMTVFITLERCLCVTFPLKVKDWITPKRTTIITLCIFIVLLPNYSIVHYIFPLKWVYYPSRNRTILTLTIASLEELDHPILYNILLSTPVVINVIVLILTVVLTTILVKKLNEHSKWRKQATKSDSSSSSSKNNVSSRDAKVSKMVVTTSCLFIVCFIPIVLGMIALQIFPDITAGAENDNMNIALFSIIFFFELTNATFNIVIYYSRSSNYKAMFDKIFGLNKDVK